MGNRETGGFVVGATASTDTGKMNEYAGTPLGSMTYDANGNLEEIGTAIDMDYDYRNRMNSYNDGSTTTTYRYDALGRRISKTVGSTETRFYSFGSRVLEETNGSNALQGNYVYGGYVDEVISMKRGSDEYYYHSDDQHNVMLLSDDAGAAVELYDYSDFGEPSIEAPNGSSRTSSIASNPYLFNGRRFDNESSLYYYRTRYMDPNQGRFTTRDSIGIWGDFSNLGNGYTYVGNNPFTFIDPFGLDDDTPFNWSDRYPSNPEFNPGNMTSPDTQQSFTGWQDAAEQASIWTEYFVIPTADQGAQVINTPYGAFRGGVDLATNENPGFWDWLAVIPFLGKADNAGDAANACKNVCRNRNGVYNYLNRGPLKDNIAETFAGWRYVEETLDKDTTFYRVWGGTSELYGRDGTFLSPIPQRGGIQSIMDNALRDEWGNSACIVTEIVVPKGTKIYKGQSAYQGGVRRNPNGGYFPDGPWFGGTPQIYVPDNVYGQNQKWR